MKAWTFEQSSKRHKIKPRKYLREENSRQTSIKPLNQEDA